MKTARARRTLWRDSLENALNAIVTSDLKTAESNINTAQSALNEMKAETLPEEKEVDVAPEEPEAPGEMQEDIAAE